MPGSIPTKIIPKLSEAARTCFQIQLCNYWTDLFFPTIVSNMPGFCIGFPSLPFSVLFKKPNQPEKGGLFAEVQL